MAVTIHSLSDISDSYDAVFCDLWGCLHNGIVAFPSAVLALREFRANGGKVVLLTNAPRPWEFVQKALDRLNVPRDIYDAIVSSGDVGQIAMLDGVVGQRVWHLGPQKDECFFSALPEGMEEMAEIHRVELEQATGIICTGPFDDKNDIPEDYRNLLILAKSNDLPMLCVNPDKVVVFGEKKLYCAGALAEIYEDLGGCVQYLGKPYKPVYELARRRLNSISGNTKDRILAIGDSFDTDVVGAITNGLDVLFVTGGISADHFGVEANIPDPILLASWLSEREFQPQFVIGMLR